MKTVLMILTMCVSISFAKEISEQAKSLKSLDAVAMNVFVFELNIAKRYGIRDYEIAKTMEKMLSKNGIRVLTAKEQEKKDDFPVLTFTISPSIDEKSHACGLVVELDLEQTVRLNSDNSIVVKNVGTWRKTASTLTGTKLLYDGVSVMVDSYLKRFIDDWLLANGKPAKYKKENSKSKVEA